MTNGKKGMTLVELLVYMALAALLLAPVVMLMRNSSVNMARDASNVGLRMTGRELLGLIYDDLKNTGYKLNPVAFKADAAACYMDTAAFRAADSACKAGATPPCTASVYDYDASSFMPGNKANGDYYDTLTVRVGKLTAAGAWDGVDTVTYKVNGKRELQRSVQGKSSPSVSTVTLARNVEALKFRYSEDLLDWYDYFNHNDVYQLRMKGRVQYIKTIIVLKDSKKLSPTKSTVIELIRPGDGDLSGLKMERGDQALYDRHEIVIPIPNNGLFP